MERAEGPLPAFDLEHFLPYQLNQVAEAVSKAFAVLYQGEFGLTRTQWRVLAHLAAADGLTAKDIGALVHEDKVSISRGVAALEGRALLHRVRVLTDRRSERLHLTQTGRALFDQIALRARDFEADLSAQLGADVMVDLQVALQRVRAQLTALRAVQGVSGSPG